MIADFVRYLEPNAATRRSRSATTATTWSSSSRGLGVDDARFEPQRITTDDIREWILYRTETGA